MLAHRFGGKISADLVYPEVRGLLVDLFAEGEASSRRKWSGEEALEWLSQSKDDDGNHRFSYARLPSLLGIKSVFARGKAMIAARRRAAEPGGRRSTRRRWTAAEDEAIRERLARGVRVAALDIPDRSKASIAVRASKLRGEGRAAAARRRPEPVSAVIGAAGSVAAAAAPAPAPAPAAAAAVAVAVAVAVGVAAAVAVAVAVEVAATWRCQQRQRQRPWQ